MNTTTSKWLICGTRRKNYKELCIKKLEEIYQQKRNLQPKNSEWKPTIIEGCCPNSADEYAEEWAKKHEINIEHYPSQKGEYLERNIEMIRNATLIIAFWDGYSYGTSMVIAQATMRRIPTIIIKI